MSDQEVEFLDKTKGAIIFGTKYEGIGYLYDFVSFYPSILYDINFKIPIKAPIAKTIAKWRQAIRYTTYEYGYYHCEIPRSDDEIIDKLFRFNEANIYTHIDIMLATKLKLKCNLIQDGNPNMWYYPPSHLEKSHKLFSKFVMYMFNLKKKKVKGAKEVLTSLWGALSQTRKGITTDGDKVTESNLLKGGMNEEGQVEFQIKKDNHYIYSYARIKPFLLAQGRYEMSTTILPFGDKIVRANTDGFISKEKLDIPTGDALGQLKYEGYVKRVEVVNSNVVLGKKDMIKP